MTTFYSLLGFVLVADFKDSWNARTRALFADVTVRVLLSFVCFVVCFVVVLREDVQLSPGHALVVLGHENGLASLEQRADATGRRSRFP